MPMPSRVDFTACDYEWGGKHWLRSNSRTYRVEVDVEFYTCCGRRGTAPVATSDAATESTAVACPPFSSASSSPASPFSFPVGSRNDVPYSAASTDSRPATCGATLCVVNWPHGRQHVQLTSHDGACDCAVSQHATVRNDDFAAREARKARPSKCDAIVEAEAAAAEAVTQEASMMKMVSAVTGAKASSAHERHDRPAPPSPVSVVAGLPEDDDAQRPSQEHQPSQSENLQMEAQVDQGHVAVYEWGGARWALREVQRGRPMDVHVRCFQCAACCCPMYLRVCRDVGATEHVSKRPHGGPCLEGHVNTTTSHNSTIGAM
eukprot:TRINITY_DN4938_c0_g1_i1.p1 TRINITY_DN4938_c0_g1~~TRINITY_DN4938_c0_g1_i1.p1  ORF type:complete len:319 (-),score=-34.65 TRINITY_DN4938_c0_g1_i1:271-1227(-)